MQGRDVRHGGAAVATVRAGGALAGPDLDAARELDRQGVAAFQAGHFENALAFFGESRRLGGPPSEIWNSARCLENLDRTEDALHAIETYLSQRGVLGEDRALAEREVEKLQTLPAPVTILSTPGGASVALDGEPLTGVTPLSVDVPPGAHTVLLRRSGYDAHAIAIVARPGTIVLVEFELVKTRK